MNTIEMCPFVPCDFGVEWLWELRARVEIVISDPVSHACEKIGDLCVVTWDT